MGISSVANLAGGAVFTLSVVWLFISHPSVILASAGEISVFEPERSSSHGVLRCSMLSSGRRLKMLLWGSSYSKSPPFHQFPRFSRRKPRDTRSSLFNQNNHRTSTLCNTRKDMATNAAGEKAGGGGNHNFRNEFPFSFQSSSVMPPLANYLISTTKNSKSRAKKTFQVHPPRTSVPPAHRGQVAFLSSTTPGRKYF